MRISAIFSRINGPKLSLHFGDVLSGFSRVLRGLCVLCSPGDFLHGHLKQTRICFIS